MPASDPPVLTLEEQAAIEKKKAAPAVEAAPEPKIEAASSNGKVFATRQDWLDAAGKLAEEEVEVEGIGLLLCSEITGDARADIVGQSATSLQAGQLDVRSYQRSVLLSGVVDPTSGQPGERSPLFRPGDIDRVMKVGGKKILVAVDVVERLSAMGRYQELAEGNSADIRNDEPTSG